MKSIFQGMRTRWPSHSQVESAEAVNKAYTANENIFNDLQASGPSNMPPAQIGTNVHCWNPVSTGWQYQLMDGSSGQDITVGVMFHGDNFKGAYGVEVSQAAVSHGADATGTACEKTADRGFY